MSRWKVLSRRARRAVLAVALLGMLGLPLRPAAATSTPETVSELQAAAAAWSMFLTDLGSVEALGSTPIPLTAEVPATLLELEQTFEDLQTAIGGIAGQSSVTDLATQLSGISDDDDDADPLTPDLTVAATGVDGATTDGIDLTLTVSRAAPATVALTDPDALPGGPVTVTTEAPLSASLVVTAKFRVEDETIPDPAWLLAAGVDAPKVTLTATIDHDLVDAPAAVGIGDLIANGTVELSATNADSLFDPDGDGRLQFLELANDGTTIPGELILTPNQLIEPTRSGTAAASIALTSSLVTLSGPVSIGVDPATSNLATGDPVVQLTGAAADLAELDRFQDVTSFDLVNALVQYATLLRAAQTNPSVDLDLPIVDGRSSDLLDLAADLAGFTDDRIVAVPTGSDGDTTDDPDGDIPPPIATDFSTIGELVDLLEAETWTVDPITVAYNESTTTPRVTLGLHLAKTLDTTWTELVIPAPPAGQQPAQTGLPKIGDELRSETGLRGVNPAGGSVREIKTAYDVNLPLIIDLTAAVPRSDDDTTTVVEFEDPMPYERFRIPLAATGDPAQVSVTTLLRVTNLAAEGLIGFVPTTIVGAANASNLELGQDGTNPTTTARLHTGGTLTDATPRIGQVLRAINDQPILDAATRKATLDATLALRAHGADTADALTASNGIVSIDRTISSTDGLVALPHGATLDATAMSLKALDFDPAQPDSLLGRFLDTADGVAAVLGDLADNAAEDIPFVGASAKDLLEEVVDLAGALDTVRTGPTPPSLGDLETDLESALSIDAGELTWDLLEVTGDGVADLVARLDVESSTGPQVHPFHVDLGPLGEINADGLSAQVSANLDLGVVIPLNGTIPAGFPSMLDAGGFSAAASLDSDSLELTGALGPFDVTLGHGSTGKLHLGATVAGAQGTVADTTAVTPTAWLADLDVTAAGPTDGTTCDSPIDTVPTIEGDLGCLSAPVKVNGTYPSGGTEPTADDVLTIDIDAMPPTLPTVVAPAALTSLLDSLPLSFESFGDGLGSVKALIHAAMTATSFGSKLPFIGDDLAAGTELLQKVDAFLDDPVGALGLVPDGTATVQSFLYDQVRPAMSSKLSGLGVLRDSSYAAPTAAFASYYAPLSGAGPDDIRIVALCGGAHCAPGDFMTEVDSVTFELEIGQGDRTPDAAGCATEVGQPVCPPSDLATEFDLGLDGFPLRVTGGMQASAGWSLEVGFGIDRTDGFFLLDNPVPSTGAPDSGDTNEEARIGGSVSLKQVADGPELSGQLGFFVVGLEDQPTGDNHVSSAGILAELGLDSGDTPVAEPGGTLPSANSSGRLTLGDLATGGILDAIPSPSLDADIDFDVQLQTGVDADTGVNELDSVMELLPQIVADLDITWDFANPTSLDITFGNVGLDVSSLFDTAVGELLRTLDRMTDPIDPIREFLFAPIPVISDLSRLFGGGDVTFVDLAEIFGNVNLELLKDINDLIEFVKALASAEGSVIPIGSFDVPDTAATGKEKTPDQAGQLVSGATGGGSIEDTLKDAVEDQADRAKLDKLSDEGGDQADFSSPLLEDPQCIFGLLMGGDCGIIEYRPDPLEIRFEYEQDFGPFFGVLYVTIGGYAEARGELGFGFSTRGVRLLAEDLLAGDEFEFSDIPDIFLQSIYLTDLDRQGTDIPELTVKAGITAGGKISIVIAAAGVRGGIEASMALNWHDGGFGDGPGELDGKIYIDEAISKIGTPLCLFDISGRLRAFLEVYAEFGVCPFCYEESFELAEIILLEFSSSCPSGPPDLANLADNPEGGKDLVLNVGTLDSLRGDGWDGDDKEDEKFTVRQLTDKDVDGNATFSVSAFGHTQTTDNNAPDGTVFTARRVLVHDSADGNDSFLFQGLKEGGAAGESVEEDTGDNDDDAPFEVPVHITTMGTGEDVAKTGDAGDTVNGGADADQIDLGRGGDTANGDGGNDVITGGPGDDTLRGGADDDTIDGGLGGDDLFGDAGHDRLMGGSDRFSAPGVVAEADGVDDIEGGTGNDTIDGGSGGDNLYGDELLTDDSAGAEDTEPDSPDDAGADRITGHGGADTVFGGGGDDVIVGGFADASQGNDTSGDQLHGNGGHDQIYGRNGDDGLWGGPGSDSLDGEGNDDQVHGQEDNDPLVRGGAGNDDLFGGGGDDTVLGDDGHDDLTGDGDDAAADTTLLGRDTLDGGSGDDIALGDNGLVDDSTPGERIPGPSEDVGVADTIKGGANNDELYGEGGDDFLYGGSGDDLIHGNDGIDNAFGENNADEIWGDADNDILDGGPEGDLIFGNAGSDKAYGQAGNDDILGGSNAADVADEGDFLYGQAGEDRVYGDNATITGSGAARVITPLHAQDDGEFGDDVLDGGSGQDEGHGQDGTDTLYGGTEHDQLYGELGGDFLHGQDGPDVMFGDKGTTDVTPRQVTVPVGGWSPGTPEGSPAWADDFGAVLVDEDQGGVDQINGGPGDDHGFGGTDDDTLNGGAFDDHLEGNDGRDRIFGYAANSAATDGQDDLIGGSSTVSPSADPPGLPDTVGSSDTGELEMQGNGAQDVLTGDNATQTREANDAGTAWIVDPVIGGHHREVVLFDTEEPVTDLIVVSGDDLMAGNNGNDRLFGEGGDDLAKGNNDQDLIEGNQGRDWLEGNDDADDIVGGSSVGGQPDDGDQLHGGAGPDVLTGDNACIVRKDPDVTFAPASCPGGAEGASGFTYETYQLGIDPQRGILLRDLASFDDGAAGPDVLSGGQGVDVELGQDEADKVQGGPGDDYQQGNGAADLLVGDNVPDQLAGLVPSSATLVGSQSTEPQLSGPVEPDGQDDQIGGSNIAAHRDAGDTIYGDGEADFQLGDNGQLTRSITAGAYDVYEERYAGETPPANAVAERAAERFDVGGPSTAFGNDTFYGGDGIDPTLSIGAADGDDSQWGQDGNDTLYGEDDDDDQYGELGDDTMWGGDGEDAMVGDRGGIETRYVDGAGTDPNPAQGTFDVNSPPGIQWTAWAAHPLDRRVSLTHERYAPTTLLASPGLTVGGSDSMRGGPGHDSMHGAFGNDLMNGDSGGDYLFGADGGDAMWGGRGKPGTDPQPERDDPGVDNGFLDILYGGYGASANEAGADILDYQPRPGIDPDSWLTMTDDYESAVVGDRQHHHGTDWIYGGWDRDVLQGDVTANGPNDGDKLLDWNGAYNLYTHCNAAYGGWNDVRKLDPANIAALEQLAWALGAGTTLANVQTPTTSGGREAAIVYTTDLKNNSGRAFKDTPGHFEHFICDID